MQSARWIHSDASQASINTLTPSASASQRPRSGSNASNATLHPVTSHRPRTHKKSSARSSQARLQAIENLRTTKSPIHVDLMALEPSEEGSIEALFVKYNVKDVKVVEDRALSEAGAKREELRTMVGERYRDLLSAADSIVRMRTSSAALLAGLQTIIRDCSKASILNKAEAAIPKNPRQQATPSSSLSNPYALATLIKLLLDTPENIWRAIEGDDYLSAARLDALGRIVYAELQDSKTKTNQEDTLDPDELFEAFPLIEKQWDGLQQLGLQVAKRARASLRHPFPDSVSAAQTLSSLLLLDNIPMEGLLDLLFEQRMAALEEADAAAKEPSVSTSSEPPHQPKSVLASASLLLNLISSTLREAKEVFSPDSALLLAGIRSQLQNGPDQGQPPERRLPKILASLPDSHNLLRHLPESIVDYTPFIEDACQVDLTAEQYTTKQQTWLDAACRIYTNSLTQLCDRLTSAKEVSDVRVALDAVLLKDASYENKHLHGLTQNVLLDRFNLVVAQAFEQLLSTARAALEDGLSRLPTSAEDLQPTLFLFSTPASAAQPTIGHFAKDIQQRLIARSPLLDQCLSALEQGAKALKSDLAEWLIADVRSSETSPALIYGYHFEQFCDRFQELLEGLTQKEEEDDQLVLLARYIQLARDDDGPLDALRLSSAVQESVGATKSALRQAQTRCLTRVIDSIAASASKLHQEDSSAPADAALPISKALFHSLTYLVRRLDGLVAAFPDLSDQLAQQLLAAFTSTLSSPSPSRTDPLSETLLLQALAGKPVDGEVGAAVMEYLARSQHLLSPLLQRIEVMELPQRQTAVPAGPSALISRFGLLPVPALSLRP